MVFERFTYRLLHRCCALSEDFNTIMCNWQWLYLTKGKYFPSLWLVFGCISKAIWCFLWSRAIAQVSFMYTRRRGSYRDEIRPLLYPRHLPQIIFALWTLMYNIKCYVMHVKIFASVNRFWELSIEDARIAMMSTAPKARLAKWTQKEENRFPWLIIQKQMIESSTRKDCWWSSKQTILDRVNSNAHTVSDVLSSNYFLAYVYNMLMRSSWGFHVTLGVTLWAHSSVNMALL